MNDLKFAFRQWLKNAGFTAVAVLTLALGIGANTAIFSVVNAVLLRPLPYENSSQLVMIWGTTAEGRGTSVSPPNFLDYEKQNRVFEHMATFNAGSLTLTEVAEPERIRTGLVTADFFEVLGVRPILGRTFSSGEDQEGQNNVVVLSHGLWQRHFGSNPKMVGQTVVLDKKSHLVIGVLPPDFAFSVPGVFKPVEMWAPAVLSRDNAQRGNFYLRVIARLKAGVTMQQAQGALSLITQQLAKEYPQALSGVGVRVVPLHEQIVGNARTGLLIMLAAVGFVLVIACANVANLQLAPYLNLVVRAKGEAKNLAAAVRDQIHALDKDLPLLSVRPMEAVLAASISERQFDMILLSVFASLALLLAAVGIYGVISHSVSQQTRHIGIRMALGAQRADVLKLVLQNAIWQTLLGAVVGLAGALALTHVIKSRLYGVGAADPATICGVVLLVLAVALFASWLPAHRAARVDPMEALRYE